MAEPLTGDELTTALIPVADRLISAVHAVDPEGVAAALGTAMWEATGPLTGLRHLAVVLAGMCSEDHTAAAALGWTLDPARYRELRTTCDALTASLRTARTADRETTP
jgi:hypothetical protein